MIRKTFQRYLAWSRTWTKSQLTFTAVLVVFALGLALYATGKQQEAHNSAIFWQNEALK